MNAWNSLFSSKLPVVTNMVHCLHLYTFCIGEKNKCCKREKYIGDRSIPLAVF